MNLHCTVKKSMVLETIPIKHIAVGQSAWTPPWGPHLNTDEQRANERTNIKHEAETFWTNLCMAMWSRSKIRFSVPFGGKPNKYVYKLTDDGKRDEKGHPINPVIPNRSNLITDWLLAVYLMRDTILKISMYETAGIMKLFINQNVEFRFKCACLSLKRRSDFPKWQPRDRDTLATVDSHTQPTATWSYWKKWLVMTEFLQELGVESRAPQVYQDHKAYTPSL